MIVCVPSVSELVVNVAIRDAFQRYRRKRCRSVVEDDRARRRRGSGVRRNGRRERHRFTGT